MNEIVTLAVKDLKLLLRDRGGLFFTVFFPVLYAVFFGTVFSGAAGDYKSRKIGVPLVDEDQSERSRAFVEELRAAGELDIAPMGRDEAIDLVRHGRRAAAVVIPQGFGRQRSRLLRGETAVVQIAMDPSRRAEGEIVRGLLTKQLYVGIQSAFTDRREFRAQTEPLLRELRDEQEADPLFVAMLTGMFEAADRLLGYVETVQSDEQGDGAGAAATGFDPVRIESIPVEARRVGPRNFYAVSFPQGIVWAVMSCAAGFGISLVVERTGGTLRRLHITPIPRASVLGGKALACLVSTLVVSAGLLVIARLGFGVVPLSLAFLTASILSIAVAFVGIMMLLATLGKTEQSAGGIGWAILMVMAMLGGGMVPLFIMPGWIQALSYVSPVRWAILALEGSIWREFTLAELLMPCGILLGVGAVCFGVGVRVFSAREAR